MQETIVELSGVSKRYGEVIAVDNVSFEIKQGEFLVLLGPSGSGKTTILSMIGGFTTPSSGMIKISGQEMTNIPPAGRPTVTVFQDYALFPHMSVLKNVMFGLRMRKMPKKERIMNAKKSLEIVGLEDFGSRGVHQLSGGQRQRVALARALAVEPAVLLLDEPLGALDLKIRHQMQEELVQLQKRLHATFVHVTHDQEEAMNIADNIALVNQGKIEDYGPPERVYLRPATLFTAKFMGESNIFEGVIKSISDNGVEVSTRIGNITVPYNKSSHNKSDWEIGKKAYLSIRPEQIEIGSPDNEHCASIGPAQIQEVVFQGTHKTCKAVINNDEKNQIKFRLQPNESVSIGDTVNSFVKIDQIVLLTK